MVPVLRKYGPRLILVVVLGAGVLAAGAKYLHLRTSLERCQGALRLAESQLSERQSDLAAVERMVQRQNEALQHLGDMARQREDRLEQALEQIREAREAQNRVVAELRNRDGETCQDGVDLIDRVLNL